MDESFWQKIATAIAVGLAVVAEWFRRKQKEPKADVFELGRLVDQLREMTAEEHRTQSEVTTQIAGLTSVTRTQTRQINGLEVTVGRMDQRLTTVEGEIERLRDED